VGIAFENGLLFNGLLFAVHCLLFVVCCLLFIVYWLSLLFVVFP